MIPIKDINPYKNRPYMTWFLILSTVAIFMFQLSLPYEELERLLFRYGFIPADLSGFFPQVLSGEVFLIKEVVTSLLGCMFLHGSWVHLLGNMWSLWLFGDNVEDKIGSFSFLLFYLLSGIAASLFHFAFNVTSEIPVIGASGAIAGVMGAYVIMFPLARVVTLVPIVWIPFFFKIPAFIFIGLWFLLQVFLGVSELAMMESAGGVAWWAHVGGFLFGILLVYSFLRKKERE